MRPRSNRVSPRCANCKVDHHGRQGNANKPGILEALDHLIEANEETAGSRLLGGRGPLDVDAEGVADESFGTVQADTTKVDDEKGKPLDGLEESAPEDLFLQLMANHAEGEGTEAVEDDNEGQPDAPGGHVQVVELIREKSNDDVVGSCQEETGGNGIVWRCQYCRY